MTHGDVMVDDSAERADILLAERQVSEIFRDHLESFVETLRGRDLEMYQMRIIAENPVTLQEFGDRHGITRERARQIESRIIKKLKKFVEEQGKLMSPEHTLDQD
jgi:RNA polymerase sigma-32 factor